MTIDAWIDVEMIGFNPYSLEAEKGSAMSDIADISDKLIFAAVRYGLHVVRQQTRLIPDCRCHFCDEQIKPEQLFCNIDCRDDFDKEAVTKLRVGK